MSNWLVAVLGLALVAVTGVAAFFGEPRAVTLLLRLGQERPGRVAGLVGLGHSALLLLWILVYVSAGILQTPPGPAAPWLVTALVLIHGPVVWMFIPAAGTWPTFERQHGPNRTLYRSVYWTSMPFVVLGFGVCLGAFFTVFVG